MKYVNFFKELFESMEVYRKRVLLIYLKKNDGDFINESGFLKSDTNCLCLEFKIFLMKRNEKYLDYIKKEEESVLERILNK